MESLWGRRHLAMLVTCMPVARLVFFKRHPYQPVPHPDGRPDADQDNSKCGRNTPSGSEDQHQDPGDHGRCDQEPAAGADEHTP